MEIATETALEPTLNKIMQEFLDHNFIKEDKLLKRIVQNRKKAAEEAATLKN